jgi:hypothetical protein
MLKCQAEPAPDPMKRGQGLPVIRSLDLLNLAFLFLCTLLSRCSAPPATTSKPGSNQQGVILLH